MRIIHYPSTLTIILGGNPLTKMDGLSSSFQYEESNYMLAQAMEEYALDSVEAAYTDTGELLQIGFMASGGGFHDVNASHWYDQKHSSFPSQTCS